MHRLLTEHRTLPGFQTLAVTWKATGGGVNNFASHSAEMMGMEGGRRSTTSASMLWVRIDKVSTKSPLLPQLPT